MCRFTLYLGPPITLSSLITEPTNSLIHQSVQCREREEPLNGDGFGLAWYVPELSPEPALFRSVSPAWSNVNLRQLAKVTRSGCVLAHVRAATQGFAVTETNCHPFTHGPYAFMHDGDIGGFRDIRRALLDRLSDEAFHAIGGTTDSEHLFALFLDRLKRPEHPMAALSEHRLSTVEERGGGLSGVPYSFAQGAHGMARALKSALQEIVELSKTAAADNECHLNVAVADGRCAVVSRFTTARPEAADSLYFNQGRRYTCEGGVCRVLDPNRGHGVVLVSSERLSDDSGWKAVPVNHLVMIDEHGNVKVSPF